MLEMPWIDICNANDPVSAWPSTCSLPGGRAETAGHGYGSVGRAAGHRRSSSWTESFTFNFEGSSGGLPELKISSPQVVPRQHQVQSVDQQDAEVHAVTRTTIRNTATPAAADAVLCCEALANASKVPAGGEAGLAGSKALPLPPGLQRLEHQDAKFAERSPHRTAGHWEGQTVHNEIARGMRRSTGRAC